MRILYVSVEVAPLAKVGGLADVAASLPAELARQGHDVITVMPTYGMVLDDPLVHRTAPPLEFSFTLGPKSDNAILHQVTIEGRKTWLIEGPESFANCRHSEQLYAASRDDYLWFSAALLAACGAIGWTPEVVHANDWHTGFVPVLMREIGPCTWNETGTVFTIHNLAYQGEFGMDTLDVCGLPHSLFNPNQLETYGAVNFLKSGCAYADITTTVSPTYAREIQSAQYGCRLEGLMKWLAENGRLKGILNGIDTERFDPATDPLIPFHYSSENLDGKSKCRDALLKELGWTDSKIPIASVISRLSEQKGFNLIVEAIHEIVKLPLRVVVLAVGDPGMASQLRGLHKLYPNQFQFIEKFDTEFAQRLYAGSDMFLMPSAYEPCGLGQLIAMRYGTVPVVRKTGGLADTVFEGENGFVFEDFSADALLDATRRAVYAFGDPVQWNRIVQAGLHGDYGWSFRAQEYVGLYERACKQRLAAIPITCG